MLAILTRTREENRRTAPIFESFGITVLSAPMIALRPLPADACGLRSVGRIAGNAPVIITSAFAADLWLDLRQTEFRTAPEAYYVVGRHSAELLADADPEVPIRAVADSAAGLGRCDFTGVERVLYPCSTERRQELISELNSRGIRVIEAPVYSPERPANAGVLLRDALSASPTHIAFFSPSAVAGAFSLSISFPVSLSFAAIGATTRAALTEHGIADIIVPEHPLPESLARAIAGSSGQ